MYLATFNLYTHVRNYLGNSEKGSSRAAEKRTAVKGRVGRLPPVGGGDTRFFEKFSAKFPPPAVYVGIRSSP